MKPTWLVRAGDGNELIEIFRRGHVAIGWPELGDVTRVTDRDALSRDYCRAFGVPDSAQARVIVGMIWRFVREMQPGDHVLTYDQKRRIYHVGEIAGPVRYDVGFHAAYPLVRDVTWRGIINRDDLSLETRNTLGSSLTLFVASEEAAQEIAEVLARGGPRAAAVAPEVEAKESQEAKDDISAKAFELIKDRIARLSDRELPELVAAVLRAMGLKTKVSPPGPDRGVDVLASPDGLGLTEPRIKVEVKHRKEQTMGSPEIRSFLGGFRAGDRGLYVSSGGFSKDAKYEADRAQFPLTLIDLDDLTDMVLDHYERFDAEGRALLNLVRLYWPL